MIAAATTDAGREGAAFPPLLLLLGVEVLAGLTRPTQTPRPEADTSPIAEPGPAELGDRM